MLYVPGCAPRYLNKARTLKVDSVIFDLGDSVLVDNKEASRNQIVDAILQGRQPVDLTAKGLLRMAEVPCDWDSQARALGFRHI